MGTAGLLVLGTAWLLWLAWLHRWSRGEKGSLPARPGINFGLPARTGINSLSPFFTRRRFFWVVFLAGSLGLFMVALDMQGYLD